MSDDRTGSGYGEGYGYGLCAGGGHGVDARYSYGGGFSGGHGRGCGFGEAYGYGTSLGSGYGDGSGVEIGGAIPDLDYAHARVIVHPWGIAIEVGCQRHSLAVWRARWRDIAAEHDVEVTDDEAADLLARASATPLGDDWITQ